MDRATPPRPQKIPDRVTVRSRTDPVPPWCQGCGLIDADGEENCQVVDDHQICQHRAHEGDILDDGRVNLGQGDQAGISIRRWRYLQANARMPYVERQRHHPLRHLCLQPEMLLLQSNIYQHGNHGMQIAGTRRSAAGFRITNQSFRTAKNTSTGGGCVFILRRYFTVCTENDPSRRKRRSTPPPIPSGTPQPASLPDKSAGTLPPGSTGTRRKPLE